MFVLLVGILASVYCFGFVLDLFCFCLVSCMFRVCLGVGCFVDGMV